MKSKIYKLLFGILFVGVISILYNNEIYALSKYTGDLKTKGNYSYAVVEKSEKYWDGDLYLEGASIDIFFSSQYDGFLWFNENAYFYINDEVTDHYMVANIENNNVKKSDYEIKLLKEYKNGAEYRITFNGTKKMKIGMLFVNTAFTGNDRYTGHAEKILEFSYNEVAAKELQRIQEVKNKLEEERAYYKSDKRMPSKWATSTPNYENVVKWINGLQSVEGQDQIGKIFSELAESPQCLGGLIAARDVLKEAQRKYLLQEPTNTQVNQYSKALEEVIKAKTKGESVENAANEEFHSSKENVDNTIKEIEKKIMALLPTKEGKSREPKDNFTDVLKNIDDYIPKNDDSDDSKVEEMTGKILTIITNIGMILAIIVPAILGVKYMLGSVEEKAEYKKGIIPYIVGSILLFGICTFVKVLQQFGESINNI